MNYSSLNRRGFLGYSLAFGSGILLAQKSAMASPFKVTLINEDEGLNETIQVPADQYK